MKLTDALDNLSIEDLSNLSCSIMALAESCAPLVDLGYKPRFDLTPGCEVVIRTGFTMPGLEADPPAGLPPTEWPTMAESQRRLEPVSGPHIDVNQKHTDGARIEHWSPPASPAEAGPEQHGPECDVSEASPDPAGEGAGAARECAAPVAPLPAEHRPGPAWTAEEDTLLVETVAWHMYHNDLSRHAAAEIAAGLLKRPVPGTQFRAKGALRGRIEARLAERRAGNNIEVMTEIPAGPPANPGQDAASAVADESRASEGPEDVEGIHPKPVDASEPAVAGAGSPLTPFGMELYAHVAGVKRDKVWTLQRDHDLLHFAIAGWPDHEIALEIGVPVGEIKPRFNVLTRHRTYKRDYVLETLAQMLAPQAAE